MKFTSIVSTVVVVFDFVRVLFLSFQFLSLLFSHHRRPNSAVQLIVSSLSRLLGCHPSVHAQSRQVQVDSMRLGDGLPDSEYQPPEPRVMSLLNKSALKTSFLNNHLFCKFLYISYSLRTKKSPVKTITSVLNLLV